MISQSTNEHIQSHQSYNNEQFEQTNNNSEGQSNTDCHSYGKMIEDYNNRNSYQQNEVNIHQQIPMNTTSNNIDMRNGTLIAPAPTGENNMNSMIGIQPPQLLGNKCEILTQVNTCVMIPPQPDVDPTSHNGYLTTTTHPNNHCSSTSPILHTIPLPHFTHPYSHDQLKSRITCTKVRFHWLIILFKVFLTN